MKRPWMPLYVADYLADTAHLTAAESGAYLHLIMHYWQTGALPQESQKLARIAKMTDKEWAKSKATIAEFFSDGWKHKRVDRELSDAAAAYERRANAGSKGGNAKALLDSDGSNATALQKQSPSSSDSSLKKEERADRKRSAAPLPEDWKPNQEEFAACVAERGSETANEILEKFRHWAAYSPHAKVLDWDARWQKWLKDERSDAGKMNGARADLKPVNPAESGVLVRTGTPEWRAWEQHYRMTTNRGPPVTKAGDGWYFPSQWPPNSEASPRSKSDEISGAAA